MPLPLQHLHTLLRMTLGPREEVAAFQLDRLQRMIAHTWRHNPTVSSWWRQAGLEPTPLHSIRDLAQYPLTNKAQYRREPIATLTSENYRRTALSKHLTSGSTGLPVEIYRTRLEDLVLRSFRLRVHRDYGCGWFDRRAAMRTSLGAFEKHRPFWMRFGVLRRNELSPLHLDTPQIVARLRQLRPFALGGHADAIWRISLEASPEELRALQIRFITMGVQTVTQDMQQRVSEAFGCPVYITYGAAEFNMLASQCPDTGLLHLNEEGSLVEILRDGRPVADGEEGEVVATNLHSLSVPYVRYALDDWATMGPERCPCGQPFRTLRSVQGRLAEFFYFSDGRRVHPFQLINPLLDFVGWLREYRVVQVSRQAVDVWYTLLPGAPNQQEASAAIERAVGTAAGVQVQVRAIPLETMPLSNRGKNKMFEALPKPTDIA